MSSNRNLVASRERLHERPISDYLLLYTSVLKYFRPESTISVTTLASGPRHPVLHSAGGVLPLELYEDLRTTG